MPPVWPLASRVPRPGEELEPFGHHSLLFHPCHSKQKDPSEAGFLWWCGSVVRVAMVDLANESTRPCGEYFSLFRPHSHTWR